VTTGGGRGFAARGFGVRAITGLTLTDYLW
jgi:hypothetical protein